MKDSEYYYLYLASGAIIIGLIFRAFFESGGIIGVGRLSGNIIPLIMVVLIFKLPYLRKKTLLK